ncbi:GntR family transcriptional regulator [Anaerorhabdus furcosa]|uniref:GntR family transcriptional regulator n=1 Tax=Anaerorhabdus furcosa TaxID=118967 RepID=A0A1T4QB74_9FIRM|nr:GntR family transcriptional regulator [Anaerorhabdus furcosa]SKA00914.1 GntR family transcriptional regulator [Anaerorhabdus furcosa]
MFLITLQGNEPIFEQIITQIIRFIDLGVLNPNDKLPSVRMLAQELGITPNTVVKAYQILEERGYVYTYQKKGVFVCGDMKEIDSQHLEAEFLQIATICMTSGLSKEELKKLIDEMEEK